MTHTTKNGKPYTITATTSEQMQIFTVDFLEPTSKGETYAIILHRKKGSEELTTTISATNKDGTPAAFIRAKQLNPARDPGTGKPLKIKVSKSNAIKLIERAAIIAY